MPYRDVNLGDDHYEYMDRILTLENQIQFVSERINGAKRSTEKKVRLKIDGSEMDRETWIAESEVERDKLQVQLERLKQKE